MSLRTKLFGGVGLAILLGAGLAPWTFSGAALRREIARQASASTGFSVELTGKAIFALLPRPRVKIEGFSARDRDGLVTVDADVLRGDLRVLPMLLGRLELDNASLMSPRVDVDLEKARAGMKPLSARGGEPSPAIASSLTAAGLASLSLVKGSARLRFGGGDTQVVEIGDIDISINWRGLSAPLSARGALTWRGQRVETALWLGKPANLATARPTPLVAKLESPAMSASIDGALTLTDSPNYEGAISVTAPSIDALSTLLAADALDLRELGALAVDANAVLRNGEIALSDARIALARSRFDGAANLSWKSGRPVLSGTLATEALDLTRMGGSIGAPADGQGDRPPLPFPDPDGLSLDLRVSAARVNIGRAQASDVGISLLVDDKRFEATLADARVFHGSVSGKLSATRVDDGVRVSGQATVARIDLAALLTATRQTPRFSGAASGEIAFESTMEAWDGFLPGLRGAGRVNIDHGEIAGVDIAGGLRQIELRPLSIATGLKGGKTVFDTATISVSLLNGVASIERAQGGNSIASFALDGAATLRTGDLALNLRAWPAGAPDGAPAPLSIGLRGAWDHPTMFLDSRTLMQRSRAAAPLWMNADDNAVAGEAK